MDGSDKLQPFVIGKSADPLCFRGIKKLPVTYKSNGNFWTTATILQEWLECFDARMQKLRKKVCLLFDNCSTHKVEDNGLKCIEL